MSFIGDTIGKVVGGITGANQAAKGAEQAAATQAGAAAEGVAEQRRQFDSLVQLLSPYVQAGGKSLQGQLDLVGLGTPQAQQQAINRLESSPLFTSLVNQGEEAILQNASATGGLRGGNTQRALAEFRPDLLAKIIESQYGKLGGLTALGQSSAAGQGNAGLSTASNIGNLLAQQGAAVAGGQLARGNVARQSFGDILSIAGGVSGLGGFGGGGGGGSSGGSYFGGIKF